MNKVVAAAINAGQDAGMAGARKYRQLGLTITARRGRRIVQHLSLVNIATALGRRVHVELESA